MCRNLGWDLAFLDHSLPQTHWNRNETAQGWNNKDLNCEILVDQQKIGSSQLCNSFYSPLCWEVKWNYLGGSSCRNCATLGCVPGFLSWTGVTGFSQGWHKGGIITPATPVGGAQGNWVPGIGQDNDCHGYQTFIYVIPSRWSSVCGPCWGLCFLQREVLLGVCDSQSQMIRQKDSTDKSQRTWLFYSPPVCKNPGLWSREEQLFSHSSSSGSKPATSLLCNLQCCGVSAGRTLK